MAILGVADGILVKRLCFHVTILRIAMTSLLEISLEISSNQPWLDDEMYAVGVESGRVLFDADGACVENAGPHDCLQIRFYFCRVPSANLQNIGAVPHVANAPYQICILKVR